MRVITTKTEVYKFDELSEKGKQKALENLYDLNVMHEWWDGIYMDGLTIELAITSFDLGRAQSITGEIKYSHRDTIKLIIENHGKECDTYKTCIDYVCQNSAERDPKEFKNDLLECYWRMLRDAYEYYTSEQSIKESIHANDYEFTNEGELI